MKMVPKMASSPVVCLIVVFLTYGLIETSSVVCNNRCSKCADNCCTKCFYGYWGYSCHLECVNCWLAGCNKSSGRCIQCKPGLYGFHCDKHCPNNCRASWYDGVVNCNRHTGKCLEGCKNGWWGDQCQHKCSPGCQETCFQVDGVCISDCREGLYGRHCNKTCSAGCSTVSCDWLTGNCHGGCRCGYKGDTCEDVCSANCKTPCKQDTEAKCLTCVEGCRDGFYGDQCLKVCPDKCKSCERLDGDYCITCRTGTKGRDCKEEVAQEVIVERMTERVAVDITDLEDHGGKGEEVTKPGKELTTPSIHAAGDRSLGTLSLFLIPVSFGLAMILDLPP